MLVRKDLLEQLIDMAAQSAEYLNNKKWVTIDGNHVLIEDNKKEEEKKPKSLFRTDVGVTTNKGSNITIIDSRGKGTRIKTTKDENLTPDKYPEIDIKIHKVKIRGAELKTENLIKNDKLLQKYLDKGYKIAEETNETAYDNWYHLKANIADKKEIMATPLKKWDVKKYTIDWGAKQRGQGKRIGGGMVVGSMSDAPTGKKEYTSILGNLPEYEDVKDNFGGYMGEYEQLAYLKARNYGMTREEAEKFAYTIRD